MARTVFGHGTPITPEWANAISRPQITGLDEDGHLPLLTNSNFSNQPGTVVYDFYNSIDRGQVIRDVAGGLAIYVHSSRVLRGNTEVVTIPDRVFNLPDNSINFVSIVESSSGIGYEFTPTAPTNGVRLARVTTGSGAILSIEDLRFDFIWLPPVESLSLFGGSAPTDITITGTETLSGVVQCRNFTVPASATLLIDRALSIRASGEVKIDGIVQAKLNPYLSVQDAPFSFGVGNNSGQFTLSNNDFPRSTGVGNRYREFNPAPYLGALNVSYSGYSTGDRAALVTLYPQFFGITNPTAGAIFRVNAAGTCTVNGVINCSAIGTGSVNPQAGWLVGGAHPLTSLAPQTYAFNIDIVPAQEPAGQCVLQSLRSVTVSGSAVISANGADRAPAFKIVYSNANPSGLVQPPSGVGAGGGGSIHFQAPVLSVSPSANISVAAGNQSPGISLDGLGASGNGYLSSGAVLPTAGTITSSTEIPQEFI